MSLRTAKALSPRGSEQTPGLQTNEWVEETFMWGGWFLHDAFLNLKKTTALRNICAINRCNQLKTWILVCLLVLFLNNFCHNPNPMSDQDNQANVTKQVAQLKAWGHMTKTNSPSPVYAEENILISNVGFSCNIFKYTSLTKIKEFSHWFTSM